MAPPTLTRGRLRAAAEVAALTSRRADTFTLNRSTRPLNRVIPAVLHLIRKLTLLLKFARAS